MANTTRVGEETYTFLEGEAYAFFDCKATKSEINGKLSNIRKRARVPAGLELSLMETNELARQPEISSVLLKYITQQKVSPIYSTAQRHLMGSVPPKPIRELKYAIKAKGLDSNVEAASYLPNLLNSVWYQFERGRPFNGVVVGNADEDGKEDYQVYEND